MITGEFETFARGRGNDLYLIREYMPDDSARHVDWKATARTGALKVREFSREDERKLRVVFDNPTPVSCYPPFMNKPCAWPLRSDGTSTTKMSKSLLSPPVWSLPKTFSASSAIWRWSNRRRRRPVFSRLRASDDYNLIVTARAAAELPAPLAARSYVISLAGTTGGKTTAGAFPNLLLSRSALFTFFFASSDFRHILRPDPDLKPS